MVDSAPQPRQIGGWSLDSALGRGAFGEVWLAHRDSDGVKGALKLRHESMHGRIELPDLAQVSAVRHPNLAEVLDAGRTEEGVAYVVTRYVSGNSLGERLAQSGPLPVSDVRALGRAMAAGLSAIHARGLVHRDLKPDNVMLPENGQLGDATLIDFGLAGTQHDDTRLTQSGVLLGSPAYMSPEQASGLGLNHQSDLWSLGVVLYQSATGRLPFSGEGPLGTLAAVIGEEPDMGPVPSELRSAVSWALTKNLVDRVPDALSLSQALSDDAPNESGQSSGAHTSREHTGSHHLPRPTPAAPPAASRSAQPETQHQPLRSKLAPGSVARWWLVGGAIAISASLFWWLLSTNATAEPGSPSSFWTDWIKPAAFLVGCGLVGGALALFAVRFFLRKNSGGAPRQSAQQLLARKGDVTRSYALAIDELVTAYARNPGARVTDSIAVVLNNFQGIRPSQPDASFDPKEHLDVILKALEIVARIDALTQPWYKRHEKLLAAISTLTTVIVAWVGMGKDASSWFQKDVSDRIIAGCPARPLSPGVSVRLRSARGENLIWSIAGQEILASPDFVWPRDALTVAQPGSRGGTGLHAVWARPEHANEHPRERCVIEVK